MAEQVMLQRLLARCPELASEPAIKALQDGTVSAVGRRLRRQGCRRAVLLLNQQR